MSQDPAPQLAEALSRSGAVVKVDAVARATGGLSQETWLVDIWADTDRYKAVLRLPTRASSSRAISTQRAALQAVAGTATPTPAVLWWDDDADNPLGRPFLVMERIDGAIPAGWHELPEGERVSLGEQAMESLAALHAAEVAVTGPAGDLDRPDGDPAEAELAWYRDRIHRFGGSHPVLSAALWWLERHLPPPPARLSLVHNDYRMGNFVISGGTLRAVLDW